MSGSATANVDLYNSCEDTIVGHPVLPNRTAALECGLNIYYSNNGSDFAACCGGAPSQCGCWQYCSYTPVACPAYSPAFENATQARRSLKILFASQTSMQRFRKGQFRQAQDSGSDREARRALGGHC